MGIKAEAETLKEQLDQARRILESWEQDPKYNQALTQLKVLKEEIGSINLIIPGLIKAIEAWELQHTPFNINQDLSIQLTNLQQTLKDKVGKPINEIRQQIGVSETDDRETLEFLKRLEIINVAKKQDDLERSSRHPALSSFPESAPPYLSKLQGNGSSPNNLYNPYLTIGQEIHWDRRPVIELFVQMLARSREHQYCVLGIQAPKDADLDSLVERLSMTATHHSIQQGNLLCASVILRHRQSIQELVSEILSELCSAAEKAGQKSICDQISFLENVKDSINSSKKLSGYQLANSLYSCLKHLAQNCTVVLLLSHFEEILDSTDGTGIWLTDKWLIQHAHNIPGLIAVVTGAKGLEPLENMTAKKIFCFNPLPPMTWEDVVSWAREVYKLEWFDEQHSRALYEMHEGSVKDIRNALRWESVKSKLWSSTQSAPSMANPVSQTHLN